MGRGLEPGSGRPADRGGGPNDFVQFQVRPRATGWFHRLVADDCGGINVVGLTQVTDEPDQRLSLLGCGWMLIKVSDQANTDTGSVVFSVATVSSMKLLCPPEGRRRRSIAHSLSVANHKMVADSQPGIAGCISPLRMFFMNGFNTARSGRGMMNHNVLPASQCCPRQPVTADRSRWLTKSGRTKANWGGTVRKQGN